MNKIKRTFLIIALLLGACGTLSPTETSALETDALTLANIGVSAVATYYGGPAAGQIASSGLSAIATVLQSYLGHKAPQSILVATPGSTAVGQALAAQISPSRPVSQTDVNIVNQAAAIASTLMPAK